MEPTLHEGQPGSQQGSGINLKKDTWPKGSLNFMPNTFDGPLDLLPGVLLPQN